MKLHVAQFKINKDFIINVYVDDIYLKINNGSQKSYVIVSTLINHLKKYKLTINLHKSKADEKLLLNKLIKNKLQETDYYLGIPFTRDIKLYGKLLLAEFKNKLDLNWIDMYEILSKPESSYIKSKVFGFLNYKLHPFIHKTNELYEKDKTNKNNEKINLIKKFIFDNYVKNLIQKRKTISRILNLIILSSFIVITTILYKPLIRKLYWM
jgi:hypothetical protein